MAEGTNFDVRYNVASFREEGVWFGDFSSDAASHYRVAKSYDGRTAGVGQTARTDTDLSKLMRAPGVRPNRRLTCKMTGEKLRWDKSLI